MKVKPTATRRTHAAPFTHESHVAEQRRFDREHIEAGHIATRVPALEHEHLQPVTGDLAHFGHSAIVARACSRRPTHKLNQ